MGFLNENVSGLKILQFHLDLHLVLLQLINLLCQFWAIHVGDVCFHVGDVCFHVCDVCFNVCDAFVVCFCCLLLHLKLILKTGC